MTAKAKRAKRLTKVQELTARVESLGKQLLEVQESRQRLAKQLEVERQVWDIRERGHNIQHQSVIRFQREVIHGLLGYQEPSVADTAFETTWTAKANGRK